MDYRGVVEWEAVGERTVTKRKVHLLKLERVDAYEHGRNAMLSTSVMLNVAQKPEVRFN